LIDFDGTNSAPRDLVVPVHGGRYEVNLVDLKKRCIYWEAETNDVKRCLWFYKESYRENVEPYDEEYCQFLEVFILLNN
jgi:hypothetical protein